MNAATCARPTVRILGAVALAGAALTACSSSPSVVADHARAPAGVPATTGSLAHSALSGSAGAGAGGAFCAQARALGLEQTTRLSDGSGGADPAQLPKLDQLAAIAPSEIAADFRLFVQLEHAMLGGPTPDPRVLAQADDPTTAPRLQHVASYLSQHCGTS